MGHRSRSLRSDVEMSGAHSHGKGGTQSSSNVGVHPTRPFRQFSTRSRAKSSASFKGLHRIVANECVGDADDNIVNESGFKKSKSSDSLCRKRALSGLNMTALGRVRSHPAQPAMWRSGSDTSCNSFSAAQTIGIKPSKNKSTHSVVDMRDGEELYDNDSTTDEEVEYFTDEEEEDEENDMKSSNDISSDRANNSGDNEKVDHRESSENSLSENSRSVLLSKTFSDLTIPFPEKDNDNQVINQPSYKVPSNLIKRKDINEEHLLKEHAIEEPHKSETGFEIEGDDDKITNNERDDEPNNVEIDEDGDDHISHPDMNEFISDNDIVGISNSLTRQANNHGSINTPGLTDNKNFIDDKKREENEDGYDTDKASSTNEDYVPNMFLSQSTGVERRFEQLPSMQNPFADDFPINSNNKKQDIITAYDNDGTHNKNFLNSSDDTGVSQGQFPKEPKQQHFTNPILGLTTSLQGSGTGSSQGLARMENFLQKRASLNSILRSDLRSLLSSERPQSLQREQVSSSNVNNFAQFLKSDGIDGDSRTQRKLWLQRENSIMDLSSHNDGNDPIFMASNVEVKREFERISREYINVRRFASPVEEALMRIETSQMAIGIKGSQRTDSDINDIITPNYGSKYTKVDEFLPQTENTKLHRILSGIWKEESALFNKDTNPLNKQKSNSGSHKHFQSNRDSLRNAMGSGPGPHQRMVNSLQPTTRAVHRRMENSIHQQRT